MAADDQSTSAPSVGAFDQAASDFARLTPVLWGPIAAGTIAQTRPAARERVLDACCGAGASALPAAHAVGHGGLVDAVDASPAMAALAAAEAERHPGGLPQLRVHAHDATTWQPEGYDLVQCVLGVFFFPDPDTGTEHLVRRVRPGGRAGVTTWARSAMVAAGAALSAAVADARGEALPTPSVSTHSQRLGDAGALGSWLGARGVSDVEVATVPHQVRADADVLWTLVLGSGFRGMLAGLDAAQVDDVRGGYLDRLVGGPPIDATTLVAVGRRPG